MRDQHPSAAALATLIALWLALFGVAFLYACDAWAAVLESPAGLEAPPAGIFPALAVALARAMDEMVGPLLALVAVFAAGPPFLLAWLAVPREERRSFPVVLVLWGLLTGLLLARVWPQSPTAWAVALCIYAGLAGEVLRALLTAALRRGPRGRRSMSAGV